VSYHQQQCRAGIEDAIDRIGPMAAVKMDWSYDGLRVRVVIVHEIMTPKTAAYSQLSAIPAEPGERRGRFRALILVGTVGGAAVRQPPVVGS